MATDVTVSTEAGYTWQQPDNGHSVTPSHKSILMKLIWTTYAINITIAVWAAFTNILNVITFASASHKDRLASAFLMLSVSDGCIAALVLAPPLFGQIIGLLEQADQMGVRVRENTVTHLCQAIVAVPVQVSMLINALIAAVRCCSVVRPLAVHAVLTTRRQMLIILFSSCLISLVSGLLKSSMRFVWSTDPASNRSMVFFDSQQNQVRGTRMLLVDVFRNVMFYSTVSIALVSMVFLTFSLKKSSRFRMLAIQGTSPMLSTSVRRDARVIKTVTLVLAIFTLWNGPMMLLSVLRQTLSGVTLTGHFREELALRDSLLACSLQLNAGLNIFVYYNFNRHYRCFLKSLFCAQ